MRICRIFFFVFIVLAVLSHNNNAHAIDIKESSDYTQWAPNGIAMLLILKEKDWEGAKQFLLSSGTGAAVTYSLKPLLNVKKPSGGDESMPSGHAWVAFNGAEFVRKRYGWKWGVPLYSIAGWTAFARVEGKSHRPEDVIASAGIAFISNLLLTDHFEKNDLIKKHELMLAPMYHKEGTGLMFRFTW